MILTHSVSKNVIARVIFQLKHLISKFPTTCDASLLPNSEYQYVALMKQYIKLQMIKSMDTISQNKIHKHRFYIIFTGINQIEAFFK